MRELVSRRWRALEEDTLPPALVDRHVHPHAYTPHINIIHIIKKLPYDRAFPLPNTYFRTPKQDLRDSRTSVFIAVAFTRARERQEPKCPLGSKMNKQKHRVYVWWNI